MEHLSAQKNMLDKYRKNNAKTKGEMENKMKDLEVLENLDLNKILDELRNRDKKIT